MTGAAGPAAPVEPAIGVSTAVPGRRPCEDCGVALHPRRKGDKCKACKRRRHCQHCEKEIARGTYCGAACKDLAAARRSRDRREAAAAGLVEPLVRAVATGGVTQPIARLRAQLVDTRTKAGRDRFAAALALAIRAGDVATIGDRAYPRSWLRAAAGPR